MPRWLEEELNILGTGVKPQPIKSIRTPPPDRWWDRGEECPH